MNIQLLGGKEYARMLMGGAAMLSAHTEELNALNVFPVADGDTGTNMLKTMEGGISYTDSPENNNIGEVSQAFSRGVLLSARGNSGVILSQIFAGINEGLKERDEVSALQLANAYKHGIERSYASVQNPTEGTILTVFRESTEYAMSKMDDTSSIEDFFELHVSEARRSLEATKELLPVLAEADVVDSGGAGYLYIAEGMYEALKGGSVSYQPSSQKKDAAINIDRFTRDSVLEFGYCTEFLLRLTSSKVNPDTFEISTVLSELESLGGESVVAYKDGDIVKVHVHTHCPGDVLSRMQAFGEFLTVKIENMSLGHSETEKPKSAPKPKNKKKFSVVSVASGEGLSALFSQMGADFIISGGQTSNPSTEEFIDAFKKCETEDILVLPNNKNVILAARQAAELYSDANIHVIETKNLMQGYSALSVITPGITDVSSLIASAERAAADVTDAEITRAVRDADIGGVHVKQGDYIAISVGDIVAVANTAEDAVLNMLKAADTDLCELITLFVGKDVSAERRAELTETLKEIYCDCEVTVYEGGQDVYDYFLAIE